MSRRAILISAGAIVLAWPGSPAAADFILTDASRNFYFEVGDMNPTVTSLVSIPGFGPLNEGHFLNIPGISAVAAQDTWINTTSFGGTLSTFVLSDEPGHFAWSETSINVSFDLDATTTITTLYDITGNGDELHHGFYFLYQLGVEQPLLGADGDLGSEAITLTLDPGTYFLELGFWLIRQNPPVGTTTKTGVFEFTIIPAPATAIPLLLALVTTMRRRRRKFDNS